MKPIFLLIFSSIVFIACKPKYPSSKTAEWPANEDRFRDGYCKTKSKEECSCNLEVAKKYSKSIKEYDDLVLFDNNPNSNFWKEFQACADNFSQKKDNKQNEPVNSNNNNKLRGWSRDDRNQAMDDCIGKPGSDKGHSTELCNCMIGKAEAIFSSYGEMKKSGDNNTQFQNGLKDCEKFDKRDN